MQFLRLFIFILTLSILGCSDREWTNPFDPDCPKELFTPTNLMAVKEGNAIKLTWQQTNRNISGFEIRRSVDGGSQASVANTDYNVNFWTDNNVVPGKRYEYIIVAKAGYNRSNEVFVSLSLPAILSTITTDQVIYPTPFSATSGGNITSDGGTAVITRGVCWSTSPNPTISNNKTINGNGIGSFSSTITGLSANTTYYVRAYATNAIGTSYGDQFAFKTLEPNTVADINGNIYNTVTIGSQVWMVQNLKTTKFRYGDEIPYWSKTSSRGYRWYNHDISYKDIYGAIYNFHTAVDTRGLCPPGWHIPNNSEWLTLINYLGGESVAGGKLKATGTTYWNSPNTGATNSSGFTALPGGGRDCGDNFVGIGVSCGFMSSDPAVGGWFQGVAMHYNSSRISFESGFDCNANYVRCVKD